MGLGLITWSRRIERPARSSCSASSRAGEACVKLVIYLRSRGRPLSQENDERLMACYRTDSRAVFGSDMDAVLTCVTRVLMYSRVFGRDCRNLSIHGATLVLVVLYAAL